MRKTFCAALKSPDSRRSSATRSTKAAAGTTSPYTNGLSFTLNTVMSTEYSVVATTGRFGRARRNSVFPADSVSCRTISNNASADRGSRAASRDRRAPRERRRPAAYRVRRGGQPLRPAGTGGRRRTPPRHPRTKRLRSEEHTSELQSRVDLVCRLLLEKKKQ